MITLKYKPKIKTNCPMCGARKRFTRYRIVETGEYLADDCGICDRVSSCGYHYTPKQFFSDNPYLRMAGRKNNSRALVPTKASPNHGRRSLTNSRPWNDSSHVADYIDKAHLLATVAYDTYKSNSFVQFLLQLFPNDLVWQVVKEYGIGTKCGFTIFPYIDFDGRVCRGKGLRFGPDGHRLKNYSATSLEYLLKVEGKLKADFETDKRVMFGEHLLRKYPGRPAAIVEAEKTAVVASISKRLFPDLVWLAAGSLNWLNLHKLKRIGLGRPILLFPDASIEGRAYSLWQRVALDARAIGLTVEVSDLIERRATEKEKTYGVDVADYLIRERRAINERNAKVRKITTLMEA